MKWKYFVGACILAGYFAISSGAPAVAVYIGIALAALMNYYRMPVPPRPGGRTSGAR